MNEGRALDTRAMDSDGSKAAETTVKLQAELDEARQDTAVVWAVLEATSSASTLQDGARAALEAIRASYGWMYGAYWMMNTEAQCLQFSIDSGTVNDEFTRMTRSLTFTPGKGVPGQA